jgi:uncharacterized OB-fold protein
MTGEPKMHITPENFAPASPILKFDDNGQPWLAGSRCSNCDAVFPGERMACAACAGRGTIQPIRLGTSGTLYNYTVVHRSFPGVKTPFVAAIVDLEGGGSLKGTLIDVAPDVATLTRDLPVQIVFRDTGQKTKEGKAFLSYYFTPAAGAAS